MGSRFSSHKKQRKPPDNVEMDEIACKDPVEHPPPSYDIADAPRAAHEQSSKLLEAIEKATSEWTIRASEHAKLHTVIVQARAVLALYVTWLCHCGLDVAIPPDHTRIMALVHAVKYLWETGCRQPELYAVLLRNN